VTTNGPIRVVLTPGSAGVARLLAPLLGDGFELVVSDEGGSASVGEARTRELLDAMGEGAALLRVPRGAPIEVLYANSFYLGLPEAVRHEVLEASARIGAMRARPAHGQGEAPGTELLRENVGDGDRAFDVVIGRAMPTEGDEALHLAVVVRDATEAARFQQKLSAIERAGDDLVGFDLQTVRAMNAGERLGMLERKVVKYAHDLLNFDHFVVFLIDPRTQKLQIVISAGLPEDIGAFDLRPAVEGSGISGHVAATGRSYVCTDAETDPRYLPGLADARSSLTVPLRVGDKVVGVMDVESMRAHAFTESDRRFAELFARYVGLALHTLDLMVAERTETNLTVSGRVQGEIDEPLDDIAHEAEWLRQVAAKDPEAAAHVARIISDVSSIRERLANVTSGPQTLLGVDKALAVRKKDPVLSGRRVLVADDAAKIRRIIGDVLRSRGCVVTMCENGGEAIGKLEAIPDRAEAYELVISDIQMPDRNGYEVFSAARRTLGEVPVILMTGFGYDPHHSIVRASQEGLRAVLFKPFQIEQLVEEVRKALAPQGGPGNGATTSDGSRVNA
jgi:CheY-like chemotaxis protein